MGNCYNPKIDPEIQMTFKRLPTLVVEKYKECKSFKTDSECLCMTDLKFGEDHFLAVGLSNTEIILWNVYTNETHLVLKSHFASVKSITTFKMNKESNENYLLSSDDSGVVVVWNIKMADPMVKKYITNDGSVNALTTFVYRNQMAMATGSGNGKINIWNLEVNPNNSLIDSFHGHDNGVNCIMSSIINDKIVLFSGGYDNLVKIWSPFDPNNKLLISFNGHDSWVNSITSLHVNGNEVIVSGSNDNTIKVWNTLSSQKIVKAWNPVAHRNNKLLMTLKGHEDSVTSVTTIKWGELDKDKEFLISGSKDGNIRIWDPKSDLRNVFTLKTHQMNVLCLKDFIQNEDVLIISGGENSVEIWKRSESDRRASIKEVKKIKRIVTGQEN